MFDSKSSKDHPQHSNELPFSYVFLKVVARQGSSAGFGCSSILLKEINVNEPLQGYIIQRMDIFGTRLETRRIH